MTRANAYLADVANGVNGETIQTSEAVTPRAAEAEVASTGAEKVAGRTTNPLADDSIARAHFSERFQQLDQNSEVPYSMTQWLSESRHDGYWTAVGRLDKVDHNGKGSGKGGDATEEDTT